MREQDTNALASPQDGPKTMRMQWCPTCQGDTSNAVVYATGEVIEPAKCWLCDTPRTERLLEVGEIVEADDYRRNSSGQRLQLTADRTFRAVLPEWEPIYRTLLSASAPKYALHYQGIHPDLRREIAEAAGDPGRPWKTLPGSGGFDDDGPPGTDMRRLDADEKVAAGDISWTRHSGYFPAPTEWVGEAAGSFIPVPFFRGVPLGEPEGPAGVDGIAGPSCPDGVPGEPTGRPNSFFGPPGPTGTVGCSCAGAAGSDEPAVPTGMKCVVCGIDCADAPRGFVRGAPKGVVPALWQCPEHLAASKNDELAAFATLRTELAGAAVAVHVGTVEQEPGEASGNYRILELGENKQEGDEYSADGGETWRPTCAIGGEVAPNSLLYRRPVQGGVGLYESAAMAAAVENAGCMAIDPAPWWVRLGRRLFPRAWVESPEMDGAHDVLHVSVVAYFDFFDRLRILISGRVMIESRVATENKVGRSKASSVVCALPPGILEDKV